MTLDQLERLLFDKWGEWGDYPMIEVMKYLRSVVHEDGSPLSPLPAPPILDYTPVGRLTTLSRNLLLAYVRVMADQFPEATIRQFASAIGPLLDDVEDGWVIERRWDYIIAIMRKASTHYSLNEIEQKGLFDVTYGNLPRGALVVELGVCHGKTTLLLAFLADHAGGQYLGIDTWQLEGDMKTVQQLLIDARLDHVATLLQIRTQDAPLPGPIDLLLIDAGHDEANIRPDVERWAPLVRPGGLIAFHDYDSPPDPASPHWAVRHYADLHTGDWPAVCHIGGLLVRRRP